MHVRHGDHFEPIAIAVEPRGWYPVLRSLRLSVAERRSAPLTSLALPRLIGRPERIFISVDESLARSTLSFAPNDVGSPIQLENDPRGEEAVAHAREIAAAYPGSVVVGPHFHTGRPKTKPRRGRR